MRWSLLIGILLFFVPFANACYNPMDSLAVEVYLNKPGITYDLTPLKSAQNVIIENDSIIYRSHHDESVAVILSEDNGFLRVRVQIPAKSFSSTYAHASLVTPLLISEEMVEKAKELGWEVEGFTFKKKNLLVQINLSRGDECQNDSECATGGCSGEVCTTRDKAKEVITPCIYAEWYDCLRLTQCGCVNGFCTWKSNEEFEKCLREHNMDPSKVVKVPNAEVWIADYGKEKPSEEDLNEMKALFDVFGISCMLENLSFESETVESPTGVVDPYSFNFTEALRTELVWLRDNGIVRINEEDIEMIAKVAKMGKAGYNSHIGWYEKDGKYSWVAYDESDSPLLLRCVGQPFKLKLPPSQVELPQTSTTSTTSQQTESVCGPGLILGLLLMVRVFRK
ncbi:eight-cysteine-cluster domain-containing protein [Thermococcus argininiproducens]|uniref:Eight-cysteine-cluster domain-containing protein n=1 Tax=Thermococcus argininiproducens TaxID=2866384 RepID=A0A9E7M9W2_9EURY|nr:CGP-CTERM-anchored Cys-rich protein [Thermococcus argininiproducens]USH00045.1 eight-cysteine-cluster domain-containing protein [Thermococcus argininiproducens]